MSVLLLSMPSGGELLLIAAVALLFFGGKKIPELMRGLGRGIREFNDAKDSVRKEIESESDRVNASSKQSTDLETKKGVQNS